MKVAGGFVEIGLAQVRASHRHGWERLRKLTEETAAAAPNVKKLELALIAAFEKLGDRRYRLAPHRTGGAPEKRFDLHVIEFRRLFGQVPTRLIMEVLGVIIRHALRFRQRSRFHCPFRGASLVRLWEIG